LQQVTNEERGRWIREVLRQAAVVWVQPHEKITLVAHKVERVLRPAAENANAVGMLQDLLPLTLPLQDTQQKKSDPDAPFFMFKNNICNLELGNVRSCNFLESETQRYQDQHRDKAKFRVCHQRKKV
jgi:hypothetical protein